MRILGITAPRDGSRAGPAVGRSAQANRLVAAGLIGGTSLLLTVVRHEILHVAGALITGGTVTRVEWLPRPWTLGTVAVTPPLINGPATYYVPLILPYLADLLLIAIGVWACRRLRPSPMMRRLIVQHAVDFAALDILVNCAAAFIWRNDWGMILEGWGVWRYPALVVLVAACLAAVVVGRRIQGGGGLSERRVWLVPAVARGAEGRS
jgi:hypothetical protein